MRGQPLQVVLHTDTWGSPRVKSGQPTIFERDVVVEANEFQEQVAYH